MVIRQVFRTYKSGFKIRGVKMKFADTAKNKGVTFQVGAEDLNGNPVNSKVLITDSLPDDLGTLEFSGEAVAGDEPQTGTFK
jgi:hypothetical protein